MDFLIKFYDESEDKRGNLLCDYKCVEIGLPSLEHGGLSFNLSGELKKLYQTGPVPLNNPAGAAGGASFQHQVVTDHFASTGKVLSGLYAGEQGVGIDVAGNTTLTAGVISSVASREKNHFSTGSLISRNLENVSRW